MTHRGRVWAHGLVIILGLAAMVAGFVSGRTYAGIAGLLIAAINIESWWRAVRARRSGDQDRP
jgi:membrane protein implicated in regulation of membrane protease activity